MNKMLNSKISWSLLVTTSSTVHLLDSSSVAGHTQLCPFAGADTSRILTYGEELVME